MKGIVYAVSWGMAFAASGATAAADRPLQIEREHVGYTIQADGSYIETRETATKVLAESALEYAKDTSISYSTSVQKADIIEAYTLKPDGRKVIAPPGNFQVSARAGQSGDSPVYSDTATLTVVFPELAVGDTTVLSYRVTAVKPMFDNQFSIIGNYSPATYYGDVRVTVDAPQTLAARDTGWQMRRSERAQGARKIVEWTWRNPDPVEEETLRDSTYNPERYPGFAYSTFDSYAAISSAYGVKADAKAVPTERIRALADQIAGDASEPKAMTKALYDWVARNITYAGNCIGIGAVVPRDLDVVLDNKMGDCKDHATLLQALLSARGIVSTQALVNAGQVYELPAIPVASMVNHVINYIPSLDLYLDSTAATVPFGSLPQSVAGKQVLLVKGYRNDSLTPVIKAGNDWQRVKTRLKFSDDGSARGIQELELNGRLALAAREQFRSLPAADADKLVRQYFQRVALKAQGRVKYDDPQPMSENFKLTAEFDVERALPIPGGMPIQPWFMSFAPVSGIVAGNQASDDKPAGESGCGGIRSSEEYAFEFPVSLRIAAIPDDFSIDEANVAYVSTYRREGQRVVITRTLDDRTPGPVCSAEYNTAYAGTLRKLLPDIRSQIVYLKAAP